MKEDGSDAQQTGEQKRGGKTYIVIIKLNEGLRSAKSNSQIMPVVISDYCKSQWELLFLKPTLRSDLLKWGFTTKKTVIHEEICVDIIGRYSENTNDNSLNIFYINNVQK